MVVEKVGEHDFPGLDVRVEIEIPLNTEDYNRRPAREPIRLQTLRCLHRPLELEDTEPGDTLREPQRTTRINPLESRAKDHQDKPSGEQSKGPPG